MREAVLLLALGLVGCDEEAPQGPSEPTSAPSDDAVVEEQAHAATTVKAFFEKEGPVAFIVGTAGDDRVDRAIAAQANLVRANFPGASLMTDEEVAAKGWPDKPVVYGGPQNNRLMARVKLPFELSATKLVVGGETFTGESHQIMTVVPKGKAHPAFVFYGGTGPSGVAEINAVDHVGEELVVADGFGRLLAGRWKMKDGAVAAELGERNMRIDWSARSETLEGFGGAHSVEVRFLVPKDRPPPEDLDAIIDAAKRGLATVVGKLEIDEPVAMSFYLYPDGALKKELTGNGGDGHAHQAGNALHVIAKGDIEGLVAHEATHVLAPHAWGPVSSPMMGEGIAVWAAGVYAGKSLEQLRPEIAKVGRSKIAVLMAPRAFRSIPEKYAYPIAGLLFDALVKTVGSEKIRAHLLGATPATWAEACQQAGTTPDGVEKAFADYLAK
jgi:hypothetical protein